MALCDWRPSVDIYETESGVVIRADLPGVKKENVSVEIKENILTLKGDRSDDVNISQESYLRRERCCGRFQRAFNLHHIVSPDKVKARFKDGVLEVEIPKPEEERPKRIEVQID